MINNKDLFEGIPTDALGNALDVADNAPGQRVKLPKGGLNIRVTAGEIVKELTERQSHPELEKIKNQLHSIPSDELSKLRKQAVKTGSIFYKFPETEEKVEFKWHDLANEQFERGRKKQK